MNPDAPLTPREELEIKITALLMGQLSPDEAAELQAQIEGDPELTALQGRLRRAAQLLRESRTVQEAAAAKAPIQLSQERREKLLAAFRGIKAVPSVATSVPHLRTEKRERTWVRPFVLAASIGVLIVSAALLFPSMSGSREGARRFASKPRESREYEASAVYSKKSAETSDARENLPLVRRSRSDPATPETHRWASQVGAIRPFSNAAAPESELPYKLYSGTNLEETAKPRLEASVPESDYVDLNQPVVGSGQQVPNVATATASVSGRMGGEKKTGAGGIYLPSTAQAGQLESPAIALAKGPKAAPEPRVSTLALDAIQPLQTDGLASAGESLERRSEAEAITRQYAFGDFNPAQPDLNGPKESSPRGRTATPEEEMRKLAISDKEPEGRAPTEADTKAVELSVERVTAGNRSGQLATNANEFDASSFGLTGNNAGSATPAKESKREDGKDWGDKATDVEAVKQLAKEAQNDAAQDQNVMGRRNPNEDPNNIAAWKGRANAYGLKNQAPDAAEDAARPRATWDVASFWERPYRRLDERAEQPRGDNQRQTKDKSGISAAELAQLKDQLALAMPGQSPAGETSEALRGEAARDIEGTKNIETAGEGTFWDSPAAAKSLGSAEFVPSWFFRGGASGAPLILDAADLDLAMSSHRDGVFEQPQIPQTFGNLINGAAPAFPLTPTTNPNAQLGEALGIEPHSISDPISTAGKANVERYIVPPINGAASPASEPKAAAEAPVAAPQATQTSTAAKNGSDPAQAFVDAFLTVRKAEESATAGETQKALEAYRKAADTLAKVKQQWPKWQPELLEYRLKRTQEAVSKIEAKTEAEAAPSAESKVAETPKVLSDLQATLPPAAEPPAPVKPPEPPPVAQPEVSTKDNAFSTFSLNVSDVSFQLASASLEKGKMPEPATVRSEEFINALNYRDPEPISGAPLAFASERARYPFAHNRDLLRLSVKTAAAGRETGRPLNLVLLLDNSGSMERADRVRILKEALHSLTRQLQPQDKLSLITFSRAPRLWADGVSAEKAAEMTQRMGEITPEGGTDLSAAMDLGYKTALKHYQVGSVNRVVLLTDGAANLGEVKAETLKQKVEAHRKQGVAFDCFGVGWEGYNDDLLEQLSRNGDGRYGFINTPEAATTEFAGLLAGALRVAASDVKVQVEFNPRRVLAYRQVGYAKHQLKKEEFRDNTVDAAEIGAAESGNALYVIETNPRGEGDIGIMRVRFKVPGTADYHEHEWTVPFQAPASAMEQASSSLRLAAAASAFSEWLAQSPYAAEVTTDRLLAMLDGVPAIYGADARPAKLESMIRQAKSISGR